MHLFSLPELVNTYNLDLRDFELRDKMLRRINRVKRGCAVCIVKSTVASLCTLKNQPEILCVRLLNAIFHAHCSNVTKNIGIEEMMKEVGTIFSSVAGVDEAGGGITNVCNSISNKIALCAQCNLCQFCYL